MLKFCKLQLDGETPSTYKIINTLNNYNSIYLLLPGTLNIQIYNIGICV